MNAPQKNVRRIVLIAVVLLILAGVAVWQWRAPLQSESAAEQQKQVAERLRAEEQQRLAEERKKAARGEDQRAVTTPENAFAMAKELVDVIGAAREFDPLVTGVIVTAATTFLQSNPNLAKDLNTIVELLVVEYTPRKAELPNEIIRLYATRLTEQELKDALAFYKSPVGKKLLTESQFILSETFNKADAWSAKLREEIVVKIRAELKKRGHNL